MSEIESRIVELRQELAELELKLGDGFYAEEDSCAYYEVDNLHTVIYQTNGTFAGIIVDEDLVRKYLKQKDALNEN